MGIERSEGKKSGKKSYSLKSEPKIRAFCRNSHKLLGHFYHFSSYDFGLEDKNEMGHH